MQMGKYITFSYGSEGKELSTRMANSFDDYIN